MPFRFGIESENARFWIPNTCMLLTESYSNRIPHTKGVTVLDTPEQTF